MTRKTQVVVIKMYLRLTQMSLHCCKYLLAKLFEEEKNLLEISSFAKFKKNAVLEFRFGYSFDLDYSTDFIHFCILKKSKLIRCQRTG